jgi:hypothetical protein
MAIQPLAKAVLYGSNFFIQGVPAAPGGAIIIEPFKESLLAFWSAAAGATATPASLKVSFINITEL